MPASPDFVPLDPRVKHLHRRPRTEPKFVRLAQDVTQLGALTHRRLDLLGAPRELDGAELTLLGRLDLWLDDVENELSPRGPRLAEMRAEMLRTTHPLRTKADYLALPGVVEVQCEGPWSIVLWVDRAAEIDALWPMLEGRRPAGIAIAIGRDRRSGERRERSEIGVKVTPGTKVKTGPPVVGEWWVPRGYALGDGRDTQVIDVHDADTTGPARITIRGLRPPSRASHPLGTSNWIWRIPMAEFLADYRRA